MKIEINKERTHLYSPNVNVAVVLCFSEIIPQDALEYAVRLAVKNNEVLNCKITIDQFGKAFYEPVIKSECEINPLIKPLENSWEEEISVQERIPFDLWNGELIRFLVNTENEKTQLLIIAHHLVGDGLAITYFSKDILKVLNGEKLIYKKLESFDFNTMPRESKLNFFMKMMLKTMNRKWSKNEKIFTRLEYEEMFQQYWSTRKTKVLSAIIKEQQLNELLNEAKAHHITINSLLVTALSKASQDENEIGITVSVRNSENHSMSNQSSAVSIKYEYDKNKAFWENAKSVHQLIYNQLEDTKRKYFLTQFMNSISGTLIDASYFTSFGGYQNKIAEVMSNMFGYTKEKKAFNISNLTKIELGDMKYKCNLDQFIFIPPVVPNASCMLGVATSNNQMVLTFHVMDDDTFPKMSELFFDTIGNLAT